MVEGRKPTHERRRKEGEGCRGDARPSSSGKFGRIVGSEKKAGSGYRE